MVTMATMPYSPRVAAGQYAHKIPKWSELQPAVSGRAIGRAIGDHDGQTSTQHHNNEREGKKGERKK